MKKKTGPKTEPSKIVEKPQEPELVKDHLSALPPNEEPAIEQVDALVEKSDIPPEEELALPDLAADDPIFNPMVSVPIEEPLVEPKDWSPAIGERFLVSGGTGADFIGEIRSFDPPVLVRHSIVGGCQHDETVLWLPSMTFEWLDQKEIFRRLAMA